METNSQKNFTIADLIAKKRDGFELENDEINYFIKGLSNGDVQECHVGAMLMAIYLKGMNENEIRCLTMGMRDSGDRLSFSEFRGSVVDKHSTGGIGDKISIPLAPALAACGLKVPMMAGRGLAVTGGTLDKLESIPGFRTELTDREIYDQISKVGCAIFSQSSKLNPADRYLYAIRDVTSTVSHHALIVPSILSKKSVEDLDALVLDVKFGASAFMKSFEAAENLAKWLFDISNKLSIKTCCYITEMNNPIGFTIGNAIEIEESLDLMKFKENHSVDLENLTCEQGGRLLLLTNRVNTIEEGREKIVQVLKNGTALKKFEEMIVSQGVAPSVAKLLIEDDSKVLPQAEEKFTAVSSRSGFVASIDSFKLGTVVQRLGGGRKKSTDKIDFSVGIRLLKHVGDRIEKGEIWAILYGNRNSEKVFPNFLDEFFSSISISEENVLPLKRIYKVLA